MGFQPGKFVRNEAASVVGEVTASDAEVTIVRAFNLAPGADGWPCVSTRTRDCCEVRAADLHPELRQVASDLRADGLDVEGIAQRMKISAVAAAALLA